MMFDEIPLFWSDFKDALAIKGLLGQIQYLEDATTYSIFTYDVPIKYTCTIWLGDVPSGISSSYSQSQNDADKADFEANYKGTANQRLASAIQVFFNALTLSDGYTTTASTSFAPIEGTTYNEQSANAQRSLVSNNANDSSAGTGARTVKITYYDEGLAGPFEETVTMNGTTAVDTAASDICFIERMDVMTVGSSMGNEGTITLFVATAGGGGTVGSIAPGDNETNWVHHYVAVNATMQLMAIYAHITGTSGGGVHLRSATPTVPNTPERTIAPVLRVPPGVQAVIELPVPLKVAGPARVTLYAKPDSSASVDWLAGFNFVEEST